MKKKDINKLLNKHADWLNRICFPYGRQVEVERLQQLVETAVLKRRGKKKGALWNLFVSDKIPDDEIWVINPGCFSLKKGIAKLKNFKVKKP